MRSGRRTLLLAVAALASAAAALAIGILLFGEFGETEGRILGTTALLAGYSLLALPAAILQDQRRLPALALAVALLAAAAAVVSVATTWIHDPPETLGKSVGTANAVLVAAVQIAALSARRRENDPRSVRALFASSSLLVALAAAMLIVLLWAEFDSEGYGRVLGALVVLDALLVALQPILSRARPARNAQRLRAVLTSGETIELTIEAADLAGAAAAAIRRLERDGRSVARLELRDPQPGPRP